MMRETQSYRPVILRNLGIESKGVKVFTTFAAQSQFQIPSLWLSSITPTLPIPSSNSARRSRAIA